MDHTCPLGCVPCRGARQQQELAWANGPHIPSTGAFRSSPPSLPWFLFRVERRHRFGCLSAESMRTRERGSGRQDVAAPPGKGNPPPHPHDAMSAAPRAGRRCVRAPSRHLYRPPPSTPSCALSPTHSPRTRRGLGPASPPSALRPCASGRRFPQCPRGERFSQTRRPRPGT